MKYIVRTSKTPILDCIVVVSTTVLFLGGLGEFISTRLFGFSWDGKIDETGTGIIAICVVFLLMIVLMIGAIYLARYLASRIFRIKTGDSVVELDTEKRTSRFYSNGKLESKKKWDD